MISQSGYSRDVKYENAPWFISKACELRINRQAVSRSAEKSRSSAFDLIGKVLDIDTASTSSSLKGPSPGWVSVNDAANSGRVDDRLSPDKYSFTKVAGVTNLLATFSTEERNAARKSADGVFMRKNLHLYLFELYVHAHSSQNC